MAGHPEAGAYVLTGLATARLWRAAPAHDALRDGRPDSRAHLAGRAALVAHVYLERGARRRADLKRLAW